MAPGVSIYYYVVEWDAKAVSWEEFRGSVLGPTDPADAPADSLRGLIMSKWQELGLASQPDVGDNGVHASASPFEALAERMNWLGVPVRTFSDMDGNTLHLQHLLTILCFACESYRKIRLVKRYWMQESPPKL